jgi:alpha-ketoglutaric semialdehyde dehydrogenase
MVDEVYNLVGGRWVEARGGGWLERRNPADTDIVVARYPAMGPADVAAAMEAAATAAAPWRQAGALARGRVLLTAAAILREREEGIAADISREMGKTLAESAAEVQAAAAFLEHYGGLARTAEGEVLADRRPGVMAYTSREPLGVVLLITPWNDPLLTPARKAGPALLAGNTVVLKPAEETPLAALHLSCALHDAGVPAGVFNVVTGRTPAVAPALLEHPAVAAVSFTGSTRVGQELGRLLGGSTVRLQTEMGGKNAVLVLPDADLDAAADAVVAAGFGQAGQRCTATSRVIVHADVEAALVARLCERAEGLRMGPGDAPATELGPLVSAERREAVLAAVDKAVGQGASCATGGHVPDDPALARGWFVAPTVMTGVRPDMPVWTDEVFGPVLAVIAVASFEEGIAAVNDSHYGLAAGLFTADLSAAHRFARSVEAGQVAVNLPTSGWDVHVPFGGFGDSGSPFKEHGLEGLRFYTRLKSVAVGFG